jgi:predicted TIM-barrel fold metal-dependent hydrolase
MYQGRIIDVDVHNHWKTPDEVLRYLPDHWRKYLQGQPGRALPLIPTPAKWYFPDGVDRSDSFPPDGSRPGTDYDFMKRQLLDPLRTESALLTFYTGQQSAMLNPQLAAALCRACNQWCVDEWLSRDDRFLGAIMVPTEVPEEAAKEIRHWRHDGRMVAVLLVGNQLGKPFGHAVYDPLYRAAAEEGLPIVIHTGGDQSRKVQSAAGGNGATMLERFPTLPQAGMHHLTSMITHALFEKFPQLQVLLLEFGFTWIPSIVWRLDQAFDVLKVESPLVRRWPSEVVHEHIRFSTQPFEYVPAKALRDLLESFDGMEDLLCFSTDYPHWDADEPTHIASHLPRPWLSKVFADNAAAFFNLSGRGARSQRRVEAAATQD